MYIIRSIIVADATKSGPRTTNPSPRWAKKGWKHPRGQQERQQDKKKQVVHSKERKTKKQPHKHVRHCMHVSATERHSSCLLRSGQMSLRAQRRHRTYSKCAAMAREPSEARLNFTSRCKARVRHSTRCHTKIVRQRIARCREAFLEGCASSSVTWSHFIQELLEATRRPPP